MTPALSLLAQVSGVMSQGSVPAEVRPPELWSRESMDWHGQDHQGSFPSRSFALFQLVSASCPAQGLGFGWTSRESRQELTDHGLNEAAGDEM